MTQTAEEVVRARRRGLVRRGGRLLLAQVAGMARLSPGALATSYRQARERARAEVALASLGRTTSSRFDGTVLVDAMWDNPNYWVRHALLRAALGLAGAREVGMLGPYRRRICRRTLTRLGIHGAVDLAALARIGERDDAEARRLLAGTRTADDILRWRLPLDLPAELVYDGLLKRQRTACVDLGDPRLPGWVAEAIASIRAAENLLERSRFDLVILTHAVNFQYAAVAWSAIRRRIPVILAFGNYGVPRYVKLLEPRDIQDTVDRPTAADVAALPEGLATAMARAGAAYLERRRAGQTDDIGAQFAFQRAKGRVSRASLVETFGWDPGRPIVAVYASNWFDFPHYCGATWYRDFLDWIQVTLDAARRHRHANWLFRAHPCDQWYGGVTLSDLLPPLDASPHVRVAPIDWNGAALLDAVDAIVTCQGTVGIEAAALGKPVLISDRGWYHEAGFVKWPGSRAAYRDALGTPWWTDLDLAAAQRRAQIFAGWYFCRPAWQGDFVLGDDSAQWDLYAAVPALLSRAPAALQREVETIRRWFGSPSRRYHTFKMREADGLAS